MRLRNWRRGFVEAVEVDHGDELSTAEKIHELVEHWTLRPRVVDLETGCTNVK